MDGKYSGVNMQKGLDLLDELGLIFIVGLNNGNICMHFGFKAAHAMQWSLSGFSAAEEDNPMKVWVLMTADTLAIESNTRVLYTIPIFKATKH